MKGLKQLFMLGLMASAPFAAGSNAQSMGLVNHANRQLRGRGLQGGDASCVDFDMIIGDDSSGSQEDGQNAWPEGQVALGQLVTTVLSPSTGNPNRMIGVVQFANEALVISALNSPDASNAAQLVQLINDAPFMGGGTYASTMMQQMIDQLPSRRPNIPLVIPFKSDFLWDDAQQALSLLSQIIASGNVITMCFGVNGGDGVNLTLMGEICGAQYIFQYPNEQALANAVTSLGQTICNLGATASPTSLITLPPSARPTIQSTMQPTVAKTRQPSSSPTQAAVTFSPSAAPTHSPTNATQPINVCDPVWPCLSPLLLLFCCIPCMRKESDKTKVQVLQDLEKMSKGVPPVEAETYQEVVPNKIRERGQTDLRHEIHGTFMTSGLVTEKTKPTKFKSSVMDKALPGREGRDDTRQPATIDEGDNEKEKEYLGSILPVTVTMYLLRKYELTETKKSIWEADVTRMVEAVTSCCAPTAACLCCKRPLEQKKTKGSAITQKPSSKHTRGGDFIENADV